MIVKIQNMAEVSEAFTSAYEHVLSHMVDQKRKDEISLFVTQITAMMSMYISFSSGHLERFIEMVFARETVRDFVFRLTSAFCARLGGRQEYEELAKDLAWAMCMLPNTDQNGALALVAMPEDIKSRLPTHEDIEQLLVNNKWYMSVVMIYLFVRIEVDKSTKGNVR